MEETALADSRTSGTKILLPEIKNLYSVSFCTFNAASSQFDQTTLRERKLEFAFASVMYSLMKNT